MCAVPAVLTPDATRPADDRHRQPAAALLREFGVPELLDADGVVRRRGGKPLLVLLWLLHAAPRRASRAEVCERFWPDDPPENARRSMRQALHQLRQWLGHDAIRTEGDLLWVAPGVVTLESHRFRDALRDGDPEVAWACYRDRWAVDAERVGGEALAPWVHGTREALAGLLTTLVTTEVREALAHGDLARAIDRATRAVAVEPHREPLVLLLAEALQAGGALDRARTVLEQFAAELATTGEPVSPAVHRLLGRLPEPAAGAAGTVAHRPGELLVARDAEIAAIWRALALARAGRAQRLLLSGPPGVGRTRLLDELEARLRTHALHVVRVAFGPEMRSLPGAALAAYARALSECRGASGVGPTAAGTLVQLVPELAARFPGVAPPEGRPGQHAAADAVADLLAAITEERATVVLLDDLHWADPWSLAVWRELPLDPRRRLLEVGTARPAFEPPADGLLVPLPPFGPDAVRALLESVAQLPEASPPELVAELTRATGGLPRELVRVLRTLDILGQLVVRDGTWTITGAEPIAAVISAALTRTLASPGEAPDQLLAVLRAWGRPLEEALLLEVAAAAAPGVAPALWTGALATLERAGLAWQRGGAWVAEGGVLVDGDVDAHRLLALLGGRLFAAGVTPRPADVAHLTRRAGALGARAVAIDLARRLARGPHLRTLGLSRTRLPQHLATEAGRRDWEQPLRGAMGFAGRRSRRALSLLAAAAAFGATSLVALLLAAQPRLVVEVQPMPANDDRLDRLGLAVQPRVRVVDGFGRPRALDGVPVRVHAVRALVDGDRERRTEAGRVQFEELALRADSAAIGDRDVRPVRLVFSGPWWMRDADVELPTITWLLQSDHFRLIRASANGQPIGPQQVPTLALGADSIVVTMTFEFSARGATVNYVLGAAPDWLPRERSVVRVAGLPRPVVNVWSTVQFTVPAPTSPGRYAIIVAMGAEDSVDHLFSGTNWTLGAPRWYDGNDLHDLTPAQRARLRDSGVVLVPKSLAAPYDQSQGIFLGNPERERYRHELRPPREIPGTVLEFDLPVAPNR